MKVKFIMLYLLGIIVVGVISFFLPNSKEVLPALCTYGFEKPLWFCIGFVFNFIYFWILYYLYIYFK